MMKDENELRCRVVAHGCFKQTPFPCHNAMAAWHGNGKKTGASNWAISALPFGTQVTCLLGLRKKFIRRADACGV